jgi:hypothetical protein
MNASDEASVCCMGPDGSPPLGRSCSILFRTSIMSKLQVAVGAIVKSIGHWLIEVKDGDNGNDIVAEAVGRIIVIVGSGIAGFTKVAADNAVHVI